MADGRWQNNQRFHICHLPFAMQDEFFRILLDHAGGYFASGFRVRFPD
jgi:hypothetical protein